MGLLQFWSTHAAELWQLLGHHVTLVLTSTTVAVAIGVPIGIVAAHRPRVGGPLVALANVGQTIPSLALLGFLLPLPWIGGIGSRVAIVALIIYALLPVIRGTVAGLRSVDPSVITAATAMGMTPWQLLRLVEIPLALPSIVAGIRVATVVGVGTATIAAAIGAGGLGEYIFRGLSMVDGTVILAGAIPAAALAIFADALLTWAERLLRPARTTAHKRLPLLVAAAAIAMVTLTTIAALRSTGDTVVIGSKNFTEQIVLGELFAQTLEANGLAVTRRLNLGGTFICDRALRSGDIDVYPEYSGTALTAIFHDTVGANRDTVLARVRDRYAAAGVTVLPPLGFENTFAILVRRADADALGLTRIGDLGRVSDRWQPGFGYEFVERADGYRGLTSAYDLTFARQPRVMDLAVMYRALASKEIDVIAGDTTSALIPALDLTVLEDDRRYFPPYDALAVARTSTLLRTPAVRVALSSLSGKISPESMRAMNHAVDVEKRDVAEVVRAFRRRIGASGS